MEKRYRALRVIATLYKIVGGVVLGLVLIGALVTCLAGVLGGASLQEFSRDWGGMPRMGMWEGAAVGIVSALSLLIFGGLGGLGLFATGEAISLLIAVEENTRASTMYLASLARASRSNAAAAVPAVLAPEAVEPPAPPVE